MNTSVDNQNMQAPETKFRISLTVDEMKSILLLTTLEGADPIELMALVQKLNKAIAKASLGIITPAYVGNTKLPGMATMARIQKEAENSKGAALHGKLIAGESLTDDEIYDALTYLIETKKEAPSHPKEIEAMDIYMNVKIMKSIGA